MSYYRQRNAKKLERRNAKQKASGASESALSHGVRAEASSSQSIEKLVNLLQEAQNVGGKDGSSTLPNSELPVVTQTGEEAWASAIEDKINELVEQSRNFERERVEIELLREQLGRAIEVAESRLAATSSDEGMNRLSELESRLAEAASENVRISNLLINSRNEYQSLVEFIELEGEQSRSTAAGISELQNSIVEEYRLEIEQLREQIQFLNEELHESKSSSQGPSEEVAELRIQIEKLRSQLLEARHEAVETRLQNNELSSNLAQFQPNADAKRNEVLSWEERKEALLRQLEAETRGEDPCDPRKVLEIERVIQQTDAEIDRRDREIADLKSLLEQQAIAQNGMAIGVAAVAEMIESDAMIISERLRLKEMQQEWEQKQRQAEIEMSLERAKLARERLDLQEKMRSVEDSSKDQEMLSDSGEKNANNSASSPKDRGRGRWLARLGLRDE
jgi:hypothetical protein